MLINELNEKCIELAKSIEYIKKWGRKYAKAEVDYYVAKAQATLKLKADGIPVTLIPLIAKGECEKELLQKLESESMYKAALENVNAIKIMIRVLEEQIKQDWSQAGRE